MPDDDTAIHKRICSSLVSIIGYDPAVQPRKIESVVTGVIIASGDSFCHTVAVWSRVPKDYKLSVEKKREMMTSQKIMTSQKLMTSHLIGCLIGCLR